MKYLKAYRLNESWLDDKLSKTNDVITKILINLSKPLNKITNEIKKNWVNTFEIDTVSKLMISSIEESMSSIHKDIDLINNIDDLRYVYDDISQVFIIYKDYISNELKSVNVSESNVNIMTYNDFHRIDELLKSTVESLSSGIEYILNDVIDTINENQEKYIDIIIDKKDEENLNNLREKCKKNILNLKKDIKINILKLDLKNNINNQKYKSENDINGINYKAGTLLKYLKRDKTENVAEVASKQENGDYVRLIALDGSETFIINKDKIIGISDKDGNVEITPENIINALDGIKGDKSKMNKLKKFIDNDL